MSHWTEEWTIETVENNYNAIGCIDPEDVVQLIAISTNCWKWQGKMKIKKCLTPIQTASRMAIT